MIKKVVHIEDYFNSEASYQINELLKVKSNHKKILITSKDMSPFHREFDEYTKKNDLEFSKKYDVKIIRMDILFKIGSRVFYKRLKKIIKELRPDVLYMHGIGDIKDLFFSFSKMDMLIFRDCHMSWVASKNKYAKLYYKIFSFLIAPLINKLNMYDKVYALGVEEKEYLNALGIKNSKIDMLPHGYNSNEFYQDNKLREEFRKKLDINKDEILISYIGKFNYSKRPDINFDIFNMFNDEDMKKIKILFLGPKDEKYMIEKFNPKLNTFKYKNQVIIKPGKKSNELVNFYNAIDICLWPKETTMSSIHAQVCGARIVMEDHSSNKERVIEQKYLYKINNLNDGKNKLINLIKEIKSENKTVDLSPLLEREYHTSMKKLINSWEKLSKEKKK